jgi:hypothetical protein
MKALVVAMTLLLQLAPASQASAAPGEASRSPCASLSLAFFPDVVRAEHTYDYEFDLFNCGDVTERLVVRLLPTGPCEFIPRSRETYVLEPGHGINISSLMIAPSCPGEYRLRGVVRFLGRTLDRDHAVLTVVDGEGSAGPWGHSYTRR